jgi:nitrogen fixation/metabolism regulation signal transduction histidine kinase
VLNKVRSSTTSVSSLVVRVLVSTVAVTAVLLLVLLAAASANTEFFDRYYQWLYAANVAVAMIFLLVVVTLVVIIIARLRKGKFGTRLLAKLAFFMALVGVVPGGIIYIVSYQFVSRSIESWFDVNVETALTSGLNLGRGMLDASLSDLQTKGRLMSEQLASADAAGTTLTLLRLRDQFGVQDATIVEPYAQHVRRDCPRHARGRAGLGQLRDARAQRPAHADDDRSGARSRLCGDRRRSGRRS